MRNPVFASILSFVYLRKMQVAQEFTTIYQHQRALFKDPVGSFIEILAKRKDCLLPKLVSVINT